MIVISVQLRKPAVMQHNIHSGALVYVGGKGSLEEPLLAVGMAIPDFILFKGVKKIGKVTHKNKKLNQIDLDYKGKGMPPILYTGTV